MSITFPITRFSLAAGSSSSIRSAARTVSWLNRTSAVRQNIESTHGPFVSSQYSDQDSVVPSTSNPTDRDENTAVLDRPLAHTTTDARWKGKGRALAEPECIPSKTWKSRAYVEEGSIPRPTTRFFNANTADSATSEATTSVSLSESPASQGRATTGSPPWLPRSAQEARELVLQLNTSDRKIAKLRLLLKALCHKDSRGRRTVPLQIEVSALETCLTLQVGASSRQLQQGGIDAKTFLRAWARLWTLTGDKSNMEPKLARNVLSQLVSLPVKASSPWAFHHNTIRPLRHLLFLAGIEANQALAIDVLGQLLQTSPLSGAYKSIRFDSSSAININDAVLLLQDLLRSGVFSADLVKRFKLSEAISSAPTMPEDAFKKLLQQTLFRVMLRWHLDHKEFTRAMNLLAHLNLEYIFSTSLEETNLRAFIDAYHECLDESTYNTAITTTVWRSLHSRIARRSPFPTSSHEPLAESLQATQEAFREYMAHFLSQTTIARFAMPQMVGAAVLVDQAHHVYGEAPLGISQTSKQQLLRLLRFMASTPTTDIQVYLEELTADDLPAKPSCNLVESTVIEALKIVYRDGLNLNNEEANVLLGAMLNAMAEGSSKDTISANSVLGALLQHVRAPAQITDGFSLSTKLLRALVRYVCMQDESAICAGIPAADTIINDYMQARSNWKSIPAADYTALAGAFLEVGNVASAREVLRQKLSVQLVPSLIDYEIFMEILRKDSPELAAELSEEASLAGLQCNARSI